MTEVNATIKAAQVGSAKDRLDSTAEDGKLRTWTSQYTVIAGEEPVVADTINWGKFPGGRILGHLSQLNCSIGTAGSTLTIGDDDDIDRLLTATDIGTVASVTPLPLTQANGVIYISDPVEITSTVGVDTLLAGQVLTLTLVYVAD